MPRGKTFKRIYVHIPMKMMQGAAIALAICGILAQPSYAQPFFIDATADMGTVSKQLFSSRGISSGDFNNDGRPDLFFSSNNANRSLLLENAGYGRFIYAMSRIVADLSLGAKGGGPIWGDYDNDGDLDLFVPIGQYREAQKNKNVLLRNDRGVFANVADEAGLIDVQSTDNAIWLDYDRDSFLDLYIGNLGSAEFRNLLYRNRGDGTFEDVTARAGLNIQFHPTNGGSNGGMIAADFNNDGWPDLYVAVFRSENRLFINDQQGGFIESNNSDIRDEGEAFGAATGDIDNDGDLDLLFAAGGGTGSKFRSGILLNLGNGEFLDVTEGIGLEALTSSNLFSGVNLADIDNDGDLDIAAGWSPSLFFLNQGDGTFIDHSLGSGLKSRSLFTILFGDFDLDGFLDILGGGGGDNIPVLYHNLGNANHWLRVELAGDQSNRNGIGARILATSGTLRQTREILGGLGYYQDEMVAHFGLGQRTFVDELEIRWPSGQVDVLTDIPVDQHIRVIEGRGIYQPVHLSHLTTTASDTLIVGRETTLRIQATPAKFDPTTTITRVEADLSAFGGPSAFALSATDADIFVGEFVFTPTKSGFGNISATIDQQTSLGPRWVQLSQKVGVLPAMNLPVFAEQVAPGWTTIRAENVEVAPFEGRTAASLPDLINLIYRSELPVPTLGYRSLHFAFHPGDAIEAITNRLSIAINNNSITILPKVNKDIGVSLDKRIWQEVEIPLTRWNISQEETIDEIRFIGRMKGSTRLADIRLVTHDAPRPTAIAEEQSNTQLPSFTLQQNHPNPFNSSTTIRFALPQTEEVELSIFNLAGQKVATLVQEPRQMGEYSIRWDGRDDAGQRLASGIYLYRLRTSGHLVETRKLILLQ